MPRNVFKLDAYLHRRALILSTIVSIMILLLIGIFGDHHPERTLDQSSLTASTQQFRPGSPQELEIIYDKAWLAVADNYIYIDKSKLSNWQQWRYRYKGQLRTDKQLSEAIATMLSSLGDKNTFYTTRDQMADFEAANNGEQISIGVGFKPNHMIYYVVHDSPAARAGVQMNDLIVSVDGNDVSSLNSVQLAARIHGRKGTRIELGINRDNKFLQVVMARDVIGVDRVVRQIASPLQHSVRIDNMRSEHLLEQLDSAFNEINDERNSGPTALILDLRGLKGGSVLTAARVVAVLMKDGKITRATQRANGKELHISYRLESGKLLVKTSGNGKTTESAIDAPQNRYDGKIMVLIDDQTSGAAEIVASALQENGHALVCGIKSCGKGKGQMSVYLPHKHVVRLSNALYLTAKGHAIDQAGVSPNIPVDPKERQTIYARAFAMVQITQQSRSFSDDVGDFINSIIEAAKTFGVIFDVH